MNWFEHVTGFLEETFAGTQAKLAIVDGRLRHAGAGQSRAVGTLTLPSLADLRDQVGAGVLPGRLRLRIVEGDVRAMHGLPENRGALFQVASQFNMLEMVGPSVTPEEGVTRYERDGTQGPACAMAAGAATIYRNYLVPVADRIGQTADQQLDGLAYLGAELSRRIPVGSAPLWTMSNGYALATAEGLAAIDAVLQCADAATLDAMRGLLRIGLQSDVEVTDARGPGQLVSQAFCSALPVAYCRLPSSAWAPFACLVLEAAYEATLLAGVLNAARGASNRVLLTRLGGGAFGNEDNWIDGAIERALRLAGDRDLDVAIVSYGQAPGSLRDFVKRSGFES